jgi:hypothetical protein
MVFQETLSDEDIKVTGRHDISLNINVSCGGFCGQNENIRFGEEQIQKFLSDMTNLENQRQGNAHLESLGYPSEYTEFVLKVYPTNNSGRFAIKFELQKTRYSRHQEMLLNKVSSGFDLDSGDLLTLVADLKNLFNTKGVHST